MHSLNTLRRLNAEGSQQEYDHQQPYDGSEDSPDFIGPPRPQPCPDFALYADETVAVIWPRSGPAQRWVDNCINRNVLSWAGGIVVDRQYLGDLFNTLADEGLTIRWGFT